jgi:hypothetical protein
VDILQERVDDSITEDILRQIQAQYFPHRIPKLGKNIISKFTSDQFDCLHFFIFQVFQDQHDVLVSQLTISEIEHINGISIQSLHYLFILQWNFDWLQFLLHFKCFLRSRDRRWALGRYGDNWHS